MQQNHTHINQEARSNVSSEVIFRKAADQIIQSKEKIRHLWESRVRERVLVSAGQTSLALVNTLDIFLDELGASLEQADASTGAISPGQGMSAAHGNERASFAGYFLPQLLKEFSILREILVEELSNSGVLTFEVRSIVDQALDNAISLAAAQFAAVQQEHIKSALQAAEMSNRDLEHFAAIAAHDLKSPLATISGYLSLLAEESGEVLGPDSRAYIDRMQKASERMRNLVDRILEYGTLAKPQRPFQSVDLNNVVKAAIQNLNDSIERTDAKVICTSLPVVRGDPDLLTQMFQNLIANSIKFRRDSPPMVQIESENKDGTYLITLRDNGIGFNMKHKDDIFALYKKLHGQSENEGAGIGLATCRKVVELHGGRIWANSTPGVGSVFCFTFPRGTANQSDHH